MNTRILYTAFDVVPSPKGASTHITHFVRGLVEAGYQVTMITAGEPALPERDTYFGATLLRVPPGDDPNFLKRALDFGQYALTHVAAAEPYALVHFRSVWSGFPLAEARNHFGYKLLYEVNGLPSIEMKYHYPALAGSPALAKIKEQELAALHLADAVICPSRVTRDYLASHNLGFRRTRTVRPLSSTSAHWPTGRAWIRSSPPCRTSWLNGQPGCGLSGEAGGGIVKHWPSISANQVSKNISPLSQLYPITTYPASSPRPVCAWLP
jgi:hypothetical protein